MELPGGWDPDAVQEKNQFLMVGSLADKLADSFPEGRFKPSLLSETVDEFLDYLYWGRDLLRIKHNLCR
jgi:hypothetical protein